MSRSVSRAYTDEDTAMIYALTTAMLMTFDPSVSNCTFRRSCTGVGFREQRYTNLRQVKKGADQVGLRNLICASDERTEKCIHPIGYYAFRQGDHHECRDLNLNFMMMRLVASEE